MTYRERFSRLNPDAGAKRTPISRPASNKIIYLSSRGCEESDGMTADTPRYDIKRVPEYLKSGFSVLLEAGSTWYEPNLAWKLYDIIATKAQPLTVGTYGEGDAPVVAHMRRIMSDAWRDEGGGVFSCEIIGDVLRFYINDSIYIEVEGIDDLGNKKFCQKDGRLYVKECTVPPPAAEYISRAEGDTDDYVIEFKNASYITLQNFIIKGSSAQCVLSGIAPSDHFTLDHMEFRSMYRYFSGIYEDYDNTELYHNAMTVTNSIIDRTWSREAQYGFREKHYAKTRTSDAFYFMSAHIGTYVGGNIVRDFGHSAINFQALSTKHSGIHNCIIERNVISGTNSEYLRACEFVGYKDKCTNNTVRYNYCYDLTNSSHLMGENGRYYCNVFAYIEPTSASDNVQPFAIDSMPWVWQNIPFVSIGNLYANNTIVNCTASMAFGSTASNNTVANNLFIGWNGRAAVLVGQIVDRIGFCNNCFFGTANDDILYSYAEGSERKLDVLNSMELCSDNIFADPEFINAEGADFNILPSSPCAMAGKPLSEITDEAYLDINGAPFDKEHPSIGAFSTIV